MKPVVVLAGGLGTRVAHLGGDDLPKAMLPVTGRPFIDFNLAGLAREGVNQVLLLVGHGAGALRRHVGDGSSFGLHVEYSDEGERLLGTGGALRAVLDRLPPAFWVTYGDSFLAVPMAEIERDFEGSGLLGCMTVLENRDRWETSNVDVEGDLVTAYEKGAPPGRYRFIDYGMLLLTRDAFTNFAGTDTPFDLGEVVGALTERRALRAARVTERFWDIGTETRYRETDEHFRACGMWDRLHGTGREPSRAR